MIKKLMSCAAAAALLAAGATSLSVTAQAREGAQSVGGGLKCYYYLGVRYCYKGV
jgi:hypothetical protein